MPVLKRTRKVPAEMSNLERLRLLLPPGCTVYTFTLARINERTSVVTALVRTERERAYSWVERIRRSRRWTNICEAAANVGTFPIAGKQYTAALEVSGADPIEVVLVKRLEVAVWLDPEVDEPMTRTQRRQLRRGKRKTYDTSQSRLPEHHGGLFKHVELPSARLWL